MTTTVEKVQALMEALGSDIKLMDDDDRVFVKLLAGMCVPYHMNDVARLQYTGDGEWYVYFNPHDGWVFNYLFRLVRDVDYHIKFTHEGYILAWHKDTPNKTIMSVDTTDELAMLNLAYIILVDKS